MKRNLIVTVLSTLLAGAAIAAPLSPDQALDRLYQSGPSRLGAISKFNPQLKLTMPASNGEAALYVYDNQGDGGFFILSAEDVTLPVLGYSDSGSFDEDNMAPAMKYWLESYARQISFLKSSNKTLQPYDQTEGVSLPAWSPVSPLIKTTWNQDAPYNNECPTSGGMHCYTGCVATSMAQVMKYYEFPAVGRNSISYNCRSLGRTLNMNFSQYPFEYDKMLNHYVRGGYTDEEATAVATLMKAAGYSVQMEYTTSSSGALSAYIVPAMTNYFNYDPSINYYDRSDYTYNDWAKMIYDEVSNGRPVIYDGTAPNSGGHSFICDGYDGKGYFHFNWGWGGMSDGYFSLDVLNPSSIGIGGYSGGFNFDQDAVMGIKPYEEGSTPVKTEPYICQYGALFGEISGSNITLGLSDSYPYLGWGYTGAEEIRVSLGVIVEKEDGTSEEPKYAIFNYMNNLQFYSGAYLPYESGYQAPTLSLSQLQLENGVRYKLTFASKVATDSSSPWVPAVSYIGFPNYVIVTRNLLSFEVENQPVAKYDTADLELTSTLYYGCPVQSKVKITNNSPYQLSRGVCLILTDKDGVERFMGDSFFLTLDPGESIEKEWLSVLTTMTNGYTVTSNTDFNIYLYDLDTRMYYEGANLVATMLPNPGSPTVMSSITIEGAEKQGSNYIIKDSLSLNVDMSLWIGRGYYAYPTTIHILESRPGSNYLFSVVSETFDEVPFLNSGDRTTLSTTLYFPNANPGETYYLEGSYAREGSTVWISNQTGIEFDLSGVETITNTEGIKFYHDRVLNTITAFTPQGFDSVRAYWLNGAEASVNVINNGDNVVINLDNLGKGIVVLTVYDKSGHVETVKVAL